MARDLKAKDLVFTGTEVQSAPGTIPSKYLNVQELQQSVLRVGLAHLRGVDLSCWTKPAVVVTIDALPSPKRSQRSQHSQRALDVTGKGEVPNAPCTPRVAPSEGVRENACCADCTIS